MGVSSSFEEVSVEGKGREKRSEAAWAGHVEAWREVEE